MTRLAVPVLMSAVFLSVLDLFVVNIAFPDLIRDFEGASVSELSWILSAYAIAFAALLVPAGRLGDVIGRRRVFSIGLALFTAASAAAALAPSVEALVAARLVQAVGAAAVVPTSLGLLLASVPRERHARATAAWAAVGGVAAAAGPPLGGVLAEASWHWVFLLNVPLGVVALVLAPRALAEWRDPDGGRLPDGLGSALLAVAIALVTLGLVQGPEWDWDARPLAAFAAAALLGGAAVARSARHPVPALELPMLRVRAFAAANAAALLFMSAFAAMLFGNVLLLTGPFGYGTLEAGLAWAPGPLAAIALSAVAGRAVGRYGPAPVGGLGGAVFGVGAAWWIWRVGADPSYAADFLPGHLLTGAGVGLVMPATIAAAAATLPPARFATGIGVTTMFRQIGAALGVAGWVAVTNVSGAGLAGDGLERGFALMLALGVASGLALLASASRRVAAPAAPQPARP